MRVSGHAIRGAPVKAAFRGAILSCQQTKSRKRWKTVESSRLRTRHRAGLELAAWRRTLRIDAAAHLHAETARERRAARRQPVGSAHAAQPGVERVSQAGRHETAGCVVALGAIEIDPKTRAASATSGARTGGSYKRVHDPPMIVRSRRGQKNEPACRLGVPAGAPSHRRTRGGVLCKSKKRCAQPTHATCHREHPFRINRMATIDRPPRGTVRRLRPTDRMQPGSAAGRGLRPRISNNSASAKGRFATLHRRFFGTGLADAKRAL